MRIRYATPWLSNPDSSSIPVHWFSRISRGCWTDQNAANDRSESEQGIEAVENSYSIPDLHLYN
jgi:hypothetical protein